MKAIVNQNIKIKENKNLKQLSLYHHRSYSINDLKRKNNLNRYEKISIKVIKSNNLHIFNPTYKKELFDKFSKFLDKNKFKLWNQFDEKNSKKFLNKKDKCLEPIILSDIIENNNASTGNNIDIKDNMKKRKFKTEKNLNKYVIIISNYDDEKNNIKSSKDAYKFKIPI